MFLPLPASVCLSRMVTSRGSSSGCEEVTQEKPGVASMACAAGIAAGKTPRGLRTQPAAMLRFVWTQTHTCDSWPWPLAFWSQNKWVLKNHREIFYVKFDYLICISVTVLSIGVDRLLCFCFPILVTERWLAVSPQMTISHSPGGRLPSLSVRPAVTFPAAEHHRPLAGTMLYCFVTDAHMCEQLAQGCYAAFAPSRIWTHELLIASPTLYPLRHRATALFPEKKANFHTEMECFGAFIFTGVKHAFEFQAIKSHFKFQAKQTESSFMRDNVHSTGKLADLNQSQERRLAKVWRTCPVQPAATPLDS